MAYTIEEHQHRLAAWDASSSASASPLCRFKVQQGVAILEACGFNAALSSTDDLPPKADLDRIHAQWRRAIIRAAKRRKLNFTHGVAAKLINCYLKARFVCAGKHEHERVQYLHPPIDEVLLKALAESNVGGFAREWLGFRQQRWSRFDSETYQSVIDLIRESLPDNEPLWKIEKYWKGHQ